MVFVVSNIKQKLMPTTEYRARKLLKSGKAIIYKYRPFTIMLTKRQQGDIQNIQYKCDTGYKFIGVSMCTDKKEIVSNEYELLDSEPERHRDKSSYRRTRRNRLRYRKARFDNRKKKYKKNLVDGKYLAPSIRNKLERHIDIFKSFYEVCPISSAFFEMGQFDIKLLDALESGGKIPEGIDYQQGERYLTATLREAVFQRDNYTCKICGKTLKDKVILRTHHIGFYKGDHSNKVKNLLTVCSKCHTPSNHKESGKLWGLPYAKNYKDATYMNTVKWHLYNLLKDGFKDVDFKITYGALTKVKRHELGISKTHANDAFVMGTLHPKKRTKTRYFKKCRRNNRILSKFYDAKFIDSRDKSIKTGKELSCNRTDRSTPRNNENNLRIFRLRKVSKGKYVVRKQHYSIRPGDIIFVNNKKYTVKGMHNQGKALIIKNNKTISISKIEKVIHCGGWQEIFSI